MKPLSFEYPKIISFTHITYINYITTTNYIKVKVNLFYLLSDSNLIWNALRSILYLIYYVIFPRYYSIIRAIFNNIFIILLTNNNPYSIILFNRFDVFIGVDGRVDAYVRHAAVRGSAY